MEQSISEKWENLGPRVKFVIVQLLSCIQLFTTPWTAAHQASLSFNYLGEFAHTHVH